MSEKREATWLTQEAYDRLAAELEYLLTVARGDIAKRIQEAREEGDLKENGGYHAAKEEQGKIESRINRIENILASSVVGEAPQTHGVVEQGVVVKLTLNGSENEFLLGSHEIAEGHDITVYSPDSPIGQAITGAKIGDVICFEVAYANHIYDTINSGAQVITVQTNNATYGNTTQPEQQFAITRFRAIETQRAFLVASTSGVSGLIQNDGSVSGRTNQFESAIVAG